MPIQPISDTLRVEYVRAGEADDSVADLAWFETDAAFAIVGVDEILRCDGYEGELSNGFGGGGRGGS